MINSQDLWTTLPLAVFSGFLASAIFYLSSRVIRKISAKVTGRKFKNIFGNGNSHEFNIVYGRMELKTLCNREGEVEEWPYVKKGSEAQFRISYPVSFFEMRAAKYLVESFAKNIGFAPKFISDDEVKEKLDASFCSLGGHNNSRTMDILKREENVFFDFDLEKSVIKIKESEKEQYSISGENDYAIIMKMSPKEFPNRIWLVVAGLGEWGTSGAAWFLANKWRNIEEMAQNKSFGLVVKVEANKEESAEIVYSKILK